MYFDEAVTANDVPIMTKLGLGQYFASPLLNAPIIKLTGASVFPGKWLGWGSRTSTRLGRGDKREERKK